MEALIKVDMKSPEAKAFFKFSQSLPFVKTEEKRELPDEEAEEIALELGRQVNNAITRRFLMERFLKKQVKGNDSNNG